MDALHHLWHVLVQWQVPDYTFAAIVIYVTYRTIKSGERWIKFW